MLGAAAETHLRAVGQLQVERADAQLAQQAEGGTRGGRRRLGQGQGGAVVLRLMVEGLAA